ncbi:MAG: SusC/RagA family TonB-linked outer membrane protein [Gelidibacter sp.]
MKQNLRKFFLFSFLLLTAQVLFAQNKEIKGTVTSKEDGIPIPGVNVIVEGTSNGVQTNFDGNYSLNAKVGDILKFSYLGLKMEKVTVGADTTINVFLQEDVESLSEVVVTALGIKRQKKELGYAVQEVKGDDLDRVITTNVASALSGKVSGVDVSMPSTGAGGSTRVIIRGISSIGENNQPLYVVDGIPIDNSGLSNDGDATSQWFNGSDNGDGISSINPNDIESLSVLKGAAAAALYGSRALNGVILITTKKGSRGKLQVELTSGISIDKVNANYEDFQDEYGTGTNGRFPNLVTDPNARFGNTTVAWGPKFSENVGKTIMIFDGSTRPYEKAKGANDFFRTGYTTNNGVALSGGSENAHLRFSYNNVKNEDVTPKAGLNRHSLNLNGTLKSDKFTFDAKANYITESANNRPALGDSPNNLGYSLSGLAPNIDQAWLKNYKAEDGSIYQWNNNGYLLNPYYVLNENKSQSGKDRFIGYLSASYQLNNWLGVNFRTGLDTYNFNSKEYVGSGHTWTGRNNGYLNINDITVSELNTDLIFNIEGIKLGEALTFSSILGLNRRDAFREGASRFGTDEIQAGLAYISNFSTQTENAPSVEETRTNSVFGSAKFDFKGYLFAEFTGRNDWFSVIDAAAFYPAASLGFVFSDAFNAVDDTFSYGKFRASWAQVSNAPGAYKNSLNYTVLPSFNGNSVVNIKNSAAPNPNLTYQSKTGVEFGVDLAFFKNRLRADFTVYREDIDDQTIDLPSSATSGYEFLAVNAGKLRNEGIEILISGSPIKTDNFTWEVTANFTKNKNEVLSLHPAINTYTISEARWAGAAIVAQVGGQYGSIIGKDFQKTAAGEVIHGANGLPLYTEDKVVLGKGVPDWTAGLNNRFTYKGLTLQFLLDIKQGMDVYSMTNSVAAGKGLLDVTTQGRDAFNAARDAAQAGDPNFDFSNWVPTAGYVSQGVVNTGTAENPVYVENNTPVNPQTYWTSLFDNTPAPFIYDASYVKLREVSLGYEFPRSVIGALKISSLNLSVFGRNLLTFTNDLPNIDPESMYTAGNGQGFEYGSLPSRKSYGLNLKVTF